MRAFPMMRGLGAPVVFDVTHSLQLPGGGDGVTAGLAEYIEPLAGAGVAAGVDGVFLEVHEEPARAKSDAQNALAARPPGAAARRARAASTPSSRPLDSRAGSVHGRATADRGDREDRRPRPRAPRARNRGAGDSRARSRSSTRSFDRALDLLHGCTGRVIVTGMGKSGHHRAQDLRHALEHRHVGDLPARRRGRPRRPRRRPGRRRGASRCRTAARPRSSSGCSKRSAGSARG